MAVVYLRVTNVARACAVLNTPAASKKPTRKKKTDTSTGKITTQKRPALKKARRASKTKLVRRVGRR